MASASELVESRQTAVGARNEHHREFIVKDAATEQVAIDTILSDLTLAPLAYTVTANGNVYTFNRDVIAPKCLPNGANPTIWRVTLDYFYVHYSEVPFDDGDFVESFEIGTQTVNVKQGSENHRYAVSGTAPDLSGLIGLTKDGLQGVDIDVGTYKFSETHYFSDDQVNDTFKGNIYFVVNHPLNNAPFRGFDAGEVRFLGASGTRRSKVGGWEITFNFAASPNSTDAAPDTGMTIIKDGWDYLWFDYESQVVDTGDTKYRIQVAARAYVDGVYYESDFGLLGI